MPSNEVSSFTCLWYTYYIAATHFKLFFSIFSPVMNLMIVPMRVLMKVMRSLLKRSQRYSNFMFALPLNILFHLLTVLLVLQRLSLRFQRKKAAVMKKKIVKRKVTNRLKLPTQNRHRKKYFYNLNYSIFLLFHIKWMFDTLIISCRPKLLPKTKVSLLDQKRFLLGIYPTV